MEAAALGSIDNLERFKDGSLDQLEALTRGVFDGEGCTCLSLQSLAPFFPRRKRRVFTLCLSRANGHLPLLSCTAFEEGLVDIIDVLSTDFSVAIQSVIENAKDNIVTTVADLSDSIDLVDTKYVKQGCQSRLSLKNKDEGMSSADSLPRLFYRPYCSISVQSTPTLLFF